MLLEEFVVGAESWLVEGREPDFGHTCGSRTDCGDSDSGRDFDWVAVHASRDCRVGNCLSVLRPTGAAWADPRAQA